MRPHTAAGSSKALVNAWQLATALHRAALDGEPDWLTVALQAYEARALELGARLVALGSDLAQAAQGG